MTVERFGIAMCLTCQHQTRRKRRCVYLSMNEFMTKQRLWMWPGIAAVFFGSGLLGQGPSSPRRATLDWLQRNAVELDVVGARRELGVSAIDSMASAARLIAMGEATHGTHEFLRLRNRVFESLVSRDVKAIAIETGLQDAFAVDAYLQSPGEDPPPDSIVRAMVAYSDDGSGGGRAENRDLLSWLHGYDSSHPNARVHLYGFDLSGRTASGGFRRAQRTTDAALAYVQRVDPAERRRLGERLDTLVRGFQTRSYAAKDRDYDRLSPAARDTISAVIRDMAADFARREQEWRASTSPREYAVARELVEAARELDGYFRLTSGIGGMPPSATAYRDSAMAANVSWIADQVAPSRLFIFAHDVHVQSSGGQVNAGPGASMGSWLRKRFGPELFVFGTIDGSRHLAGSAPVSAMADSESLPRICADVGKDAFVVNLRALPATGPVRDWMSASRAVNPVAFTQQATYNISAPRWYDALIFVRDVHIGND
jgi:erythromycin esterase